MNRNTPWEFYDSISRLMAGRVRARGDRTYAERGLLRHASRPGAQKREESEQAVTPRNNETTVQINSQVKIIKCDGIHYRPLTHHVGSSSG